MGLDFSARHIGVGLGLVADKPYKPPPPPPKKKKKVNRFKEWKKVTYPNSKRKKPQVTFK